MDSNNAAESQRRSKKSQRQCHRQTSGARIVLKSLCMTVQSYSSAIKLAKVSTCHYSFATTQRQKAIHSHCHETEREEKQKGTQSCVSLDNFAIV